MMSAVSRCSSASSLGGWRCVERGWPSTRQVRRSDTGNTRRTYSIASRRQEGLRNLAWTPPENRLVERKICDELLQPRILALQILHPASLIDLLSTELGI
jgi:hypothetical protein